MPDYNNKILFLRKMRDDYTFTANYTQMLADKLVSWGYSIYIYDLSSRKLIDYNNKKVDRYLGFLTYFDNTPFRIIINIFAFLLFSITNKKKYDICHVMYLRIEYLIFARLVNRLSSTLYISIFGSDINVYAYVNKYFNKIYCYADIIIITNDSLKKRILSFFKDNEIKKEIESKMKTLMYPMKSIKVLDKGIDISKVKMIQNKLDIRDEQIVIMCGTTARIELEQLNLLVDNLKKEFIYDNRVLLIFSLTYGGNPLQTKEFIAKTKGKLNNMNIRFLTEYLELEELLALRTITDIFINVRKHDQMVASMIEALHCESHVITGAWLPYDILEKEDFIYYPINSLNEVGRVASNIVDEIKMESAIPLIKNKKLVNRLWHPSSTLKKWNNLYKKSI